LRHVLLGLYLCLYLALGFYTELGLVEVKPLPDYLLEDFQYYERAVGNALEGRDPYEIRSIGPGFLYPPPAMAIVEIFSHINPFLLKVSVYLAVNIALLVLMIYGIARSYGCPVRTTWYWYPLCLGFAPFLELLHIGQINMITMFGIFVMFAWANSSAVLSGAGLALAALTKVSPLAFFGYLILLKRYKAAAAALTVIVLATGFSLLRYGLAPVLEYPSVFLGLVKEFPLGPNSQSLVARLAIGDSPSEYRVIQMVLTMYCLLAIVISALLAWSAKQPREPLFIVTALAIMLSPNVMWYHHFVFVLLPLLVWMAWSRLDRRVVIWCLAGLLIVQFDRRFPPTAC
jgi:alpha-1,2-mannosyltransferase